MQTVLIMCLVIFLILLVLLERLQSIKIIIRVLLSLAAIYVYIKAVAGGKSIVLSSIILTLALSIINILIQIWLCLLTTNAYIVVVVNTINGCAYSLRDIATV